MIATTVMMMMLMMTQSHLLAHRYKRNVAASPDTCTSRMALTHRDTAAMVTMMKTDSNRSSVLVSYYHDRRHRCHRAQRLATMAIHAHDGTCRAAARAMTMTLWLLQQDDAVAAAGESLE
jgi:hypothetical protein